MGPSAYYNLLESLFQQPGRQMAMANLKSQDCMKNGEMSGPDREPNGSLTPLLRSATLCTPYQASCLKREGEFAAVSPFFLGLFFFCFCLDRMVSAVVGYSRVSRMWCAVYWTNMKMDTTLTFEYVCMSESTKRGSWQYRLHSHLEILSSQRHDVGDGHQPRDSSLPH